MTEKSQQFTIALASDAKKAKCLLCLNRDFHATMGKHITTPSRHPPC